MNRPCSPRERSSIASKSGRKEARGNAEAAERAAAAAAEVKAQPST
jgi:hypothetical protein